MLLLDFFVRISPSSGTLESILNYYKSRGFIFDNQDMTLIGKRGALLNHLFTIKMNKLKQQISIEQKENGYHIVYEVNTMFQKIRPKGREYWSNEILDLELHLSGKEGFNWQVYFAECELQVFDMVHAQDKSSWNYLIYFIVFSIVSYIFYLIAN